MQIFKSGAGTCAGTILYTLVTCAYEWDGARTVVMAVDGLEPTADMKKLIEKEKKGEISMEEVRKALDRKYKMKE